MKTNTQRLVVAIFVFLAPAFFTGSVSAAADTATKPYQAIVKINTYYLDEYNNVAEYGGGSGIIIDPRGLVLTNYHVTSIEEDFDYSLRETSFQVCLTVDPNKEPDCSYLGQMVSRDKDLDVALLKLIPTDPSATTNSFPYLKLDGSNKVVTSDKVAIFGYPSIGSETITTTEGIISGKINKYQQDWLKTDAVISYGNSGGAAVSEDGSVVGLVSRAHSDLLGTLGYLMNISSLTGWITESSVKSAQASSFEDRLRQMTAKQKELKSGDSFRNVKPPFSIVKPSDWDFAYTDESRLTVTKKADDASGAVQISFTPFPVQASLDMAITQLKELYMASGGLGLIKFTRNVPVTINGLAGSKITISFAGQSQTAYFFAIDNYLIKVAYDYGQADKDKDVVEGIVNTLRQTGSIPFEKRTTYESADPVVSLVSNTEWPVLALNSKTNKAALYNEKLPNAVINLAVQKLGSEEKDATNEEQLQLMKDAISVANNAGSVLGTIFEISESSAHFKLNDEINDAVMAILKISKPGADGLLAVGAQYVYRIGDIGFSISFDMFTDKQSDFDTAFDQVKPILASLSLKSLPVQPPAAQEIEPPLPEASRQVTPQETKPIVSDETPPQVPDRKIEQTVMDVLMEKPIFWALAVAWGLAIIAVLFFLVRNLRRR